MRVALIPTGRMELEALGDALGRLFEGHEFYTVPKRPGEPFDEFTTSMLPLRNPNQIPTALTKLVEALAANVHPGRGGNPADLAILLADLELCNMHQPEVVCDVVRQAVRAHLERLRELKPEAFAQKVERALNERASFHLAVPMTESWLFADQNVLSIASVPAQYLPPMLRPGVDVECFETDDAAYANDDGCGCTALARNNLRKKQPCRPAWLVDGEAAVSRTPIRRQNHPKAYLSWLCRDPSEKKKCSSYQETRDGAEALRQLNWETVLASSQHCTFVRALIMDIADGLSWDVPDAWKGDQAPATGRDSGRSRLLRNI